MRKAAGSLMPDVANVHSEPLTGGSSAFVTRLTLESARGELRHVVFRQHADRVAKEHDSLVASKEFHVTRRLAEIGFEVAEPLALHDDGTANGPWLVTEWIEGSTAVGSADLDSSLTQMADFLARLHAVDPDGLRVPGLHVIENPVEVLRDVVPAGGTGESLVSRLNAGVRRTPNADVVLHGDFWPGNVMFHRGELVAVLDWEDAQLGDPLVDLACARVEVTCAYGPGACEDFTLAYLAAAAQRSTPLVLDDLALWEAYVSSTALRSMHLWGLSPVDESTRRATTRDFFAAAATRLIAAH